ncbi:MAG: 7-carboxy-7-deazaguanine synthase QueE [Candidatus Peregrinibacteria bacterium]
MQISEIFYSIQGEGTNLGIPAVFLRLSGCNLRCEWCDTAYAWKKGKEMKTSEILSKIKSFPAHHLVITGGEPLLQQDELKLLLELLKNYYIEIETNGTIKPKISRLVNQYNCSPKSQNLKKFPISKTFYKFVIGDKKDLKTTKEIISTHKIPAKKMILMPKGTNAAQLEKTSKWLAEICLRENLRFTPRLHINLWNNAPKK